MGDKVDMAKNCVIFLCDVKKDYINCLKTIFFHKTFLFKVYKTVPVMASFILDNLRFILVDIYILKLDKYANLIFALNTGQSIDFHNQINDAKDKVTHFSAEVLKFYDLNLRQSLE